jgi:hypothetical protein
MSEMMAIISAFSAANWIAIVFGCVGAIGVGFAAANFFAARKERVSKTKEAHPVVKATINRKHYRDGWRSVQLHIVPSEITAQPFQHQNWIIKSATLLRPKNAVLARAENDDYATGVFYPESPLRTLEGKTEGKLQRFALEFFILFDRADKDQAAQFRVAFSRINSKREVVVKVSAALPSDADSSADSLAMLEAPSSEKE